MDSELEKVYINQTGRSPRVNYKRFGYSDLYVEWLERNVKSFRQTKKTKKTGLNKDLYIEWLERKICDSKKVYVENWKNILDMDLGELESEFKTLSCVLGVLDSGGGQPNIGEINERYEKISLEIIKRKAFETENHKNYSYDL